MFEYPSRFGADSGAEFCGYPPGVVGLLKRSVEEVCARYSTSLRRNRKSVGVQLGWSTAVWGFNPGEPIDDCEYPQVKVRASVRRGTCPPGTHTFDLWLRH